MFRFGSWTLRRPGSAGTRRSPRVYEKRSDFETTRPEIGRGQVTAFRRFRSADASDLLRWGRHSDVLLESYNMVLDNREDAQRWLGLRQSWVDAQLYAVDSLREGRVVGYISLREIDMSRRTSVLGISFDPAAMGRGYGSDALYTFLQFILRPDNGK